MVLHALFSTENTSSDALAPTATCFAWLARVEPVPAVQARFTRPDEEEHVPARIVLDHLVAAPVVEHSVLEGRHECRLTPAEPVEAEDGAAGCDRSGEDRPERLPALMGAVHFEHVEVRSGDELAAMAAGIARCLKPGGRFLTVNSSPLGNGTDLTTLIFVTVTKFDTAMKIEILNASGQVVGQAQNSSGVWRAFLKSPGLPTMEDLGTLGGNESLARAINEAGQIVWP